MHRSIHKPGVIDLAGYIPGAEEPVDAKGVYGSIWIIVDMKKLHDPSEIIRFSRRFTDKVHLI